MTLAKLTTKGQVTVPKAVREQLGAEKGDYLVFEMNEEGNQVILRTLKKRSLMDLYGSLEATRPFPGKEAVRGQVAQVLGRRLAEEGGDG